MDTMTRNHIFMENIDLINRTLHRHRLLLYALHWSWTMSTKNWPLPRSRPSTHAMTGAVIRLPFTSGRNFSMQS